MSTSAIYPAVASGTTNLAIPFTYLNPAEVVVMSRPTAGDDEIIFTGTTLVLGTDWNFGTSSTAVLVVPADGAHDYQVARVTPRQAYTTQQPGAFSSAAINTNFTQVADIELEQDDQIGYLAAQAQDVLSRSVRGQLGETLTALPATRTGLYLTFDGSNQPLLSQGTGADSGLRADLATSTGWLLVGCGGSTLEVTIGGINTALSTANASITTLTTEMATVQGEIVTLTTEMATVQGEITTLNTGVTTNTTSITSLNTSVAAINTTLAGLTHAVSAETSGQIIQMGTFYTNSSGYTNLTFPTPWSVGLESIVLTQTGASTAILSPQVNFASATLTTVPVAAVGTDGGYHAVLLTYIAIGK